jgi:glutamate racemase
MVVSAMGDSRPIGVFDSGVGGLTVARAILEDLPHEALLYLGDSGRFPYGPRPVEEIRRFALEIASYLVSRAVKMLVVACNSIEVAAIEDVARAAGIPVVGVIDPGVRAAAVVTRNGLVGLIGTQATVESGAYDRSMARAEERVGRPMRLFSRACPEFVDFVERGDTASPKLLDIARGHLVPLAEEGIDTLILGCTHYPLLRGLIAYVMGPGVTLVSSADETAKDVYRELVARDLLRPASGPPHHEFLSTGDPAQFQRVADRFLGPTVSGVRVASTQLVGGSSWI